MDNLRNALILWINIIMTAEAIAALVGTLISAAGTATAGAQSAASKKQLRIQNARDFAQRRNDANDIAKYMNFMDTAAGQSLVTEIRNNYRDTLKGLNSNGMKRELTGEARLANQAQAAENYATQLGELAKTSGMYGLNALNMYNNAKSNAYKSNIENNRAMASLDMQSASNLSKNSAQALKSALEGFDLDNLLKQGVNGTGNELPNRTIKVLPDWNLA